MASRREGAGDGSEKVNRLSKAVVLASAFFLAAVLSCGGEGGVPNVLVDSTADTDSRDGVVTLREAILLVTGELAVTDLDSGEADNVNERPGSKSSDSITFDASVFPISDGGTISLASPLPTLSTGFDTIDGSQAGVLVDGGNQAFECFTIASAENAIKGLQIQNCLVGVMINPGAEGNIIGGSAAEEGNVISANDEGIVIGGTDADNNMVKGNYIGVDASGSGPLGNRNGVHIQPEAQGNIIGGSEPGDRNIVSGNKGVGILITGSANTVIGNYIGTDATGTAAISNRMEGVWIAPGAHDNVIGGSTAGERNVISGNELFGLSMSGADVTGNVVKGNYVGVDATGTVGLRNAHGLVLSDGPRDNVIGGSAPGEGNVISGNGTGVLIRGSDTSDNVIVGNYIGTDPSGSEPLPNAVGIWILKGAHDNTVGGLGPGDGNLISANHTAGVHVEGSNTIGNTIRGNSIHSNSRRGIDNTDGGNRELEPPTITSVSPVTGSACPNCTVDVYSDPQDEGELYEGSALADADGSFVFEGEPAGLNVTATATDAEGNTSMFSDPFPAGRR